MTADGRKSPEHAARAAARRIDPAEPAPLSLDGLQRWMLEVVRHPEGIVAGARALREQRKGPENGPDEAPPRGPAPGVAVEDVVLPSRSLSAVRRLQIYADAYHGRLLECLREEFPATFHAMGEDAFYGLALAYLQHYPSRSYTLAQLGADLPRFLRDSRPPRESVDPDWADFLIELATLERTYAEVFDGPGMESHPGIDAQRLRSLTPERLLAARIRLAPCVRLLKLTFPVHEYATAVRQRVAATSPPADSAPHSSHELRLSGEASRSGGRTEDTSGATATSPQQSIAIPQPRPTCLLVTRRQFVVRRWEILPAQFALLDALTRGRSVGEAIAAAMDAWSGSSGEPAATQDPDTAGARVRDEAACPDPAIEGAIGDWFAEWTRRQVIADIEGGAPSENS